MFRNLFSVFRKDNLINQALNDMDSMYHLSQTLYNEAISALAEKRDSKFDIYELDREINNLEKTIRKKILENLSINPQQEIVTSLVLTSIIIDIERIGDYSKNIIELKKLCPISTHVQISNQLMRDSGQISEIFEELGTTLHSPDKNSAKLIIQKLQTLKKGFDGYICQTANTENCPVNEAIVNVLLARYLKRVCAHLENVASSLANSFDMIGFYQNDND